MTWSEKDILHDTRWSRTYATPDKKHRYTRSRFMDATADITLDELQRNWNEWPEHEQIDFCQSFSWADVRDRKEILRFLIQNGNHYTWSAIALLVAMELPPEESVPAIHEWCQTCQVGYGANYYQAIAHTGNPKAHEILKSCFDRIWNADGLMDDDKFCNQIAFDAMSCMQQMLELAEDPDTLQAAYIALKRHPCKFIREQTDRWLSKHFEMDTEKEA